MRAVPGCGSPLRTDLMTPTPAGSRTPLPRREAGKSTTRRSGPLRLMTLYSPAPSRAISARVPVAPLRSSKPLISLA